MTSDTFKKRINSIDAMRGLVILLMLLDHVRERFFLHAQVSDPMVIEDTNGPLFWSRFVAHFCAPAFIFLTGLSAWLFSQSRDHDLGQTRGFLWRRGVFLIVLEVTLITFSWLGSFTTIWLQVIWAIGLCMLALACCVSWPRWLLLVVGGLLVAGHNTLDVINFEPGQLGYSIWTVLHDRGYLYQGENFAIRISYPVLPWIGVILLGYAAGPLYGRAMDALQRQRYLLLLAAGSLALFALLRGLNLYGETQPWQVYETLNQTLMSLFNITKYPPSLHFLLLTLSGMFIGLYVFERFASRVNEVLSSYGGAPMFFYIVHLYVLLVLYWIAVSIWGTNKGIYFGVDHMGWIWLISMVLAIALYLPTRAFNRYKRQSQIAWMKYL